MIGVYLTNLGKYNEGCLIGSFTNWPINEDDLQGVLKAIGIDGVKYEEYFITDVESDISGISKVIKEYTSIKTLNELAETLDSLGSNDTDKLMAILETESYSTIAELIDIIDNLDEWYLYVGVNNEQDLGYYYIDELGSLSIPESIKPYFDYKSYGRDIRLSEDCCFTTYGFLVNYSWKN